MSEHSLTLYIKNMVCNRCIQAVENTVRSVGLKIVEIDLGYVTIEPIPAKNELEQVAKTLVSLGFEITRDRKSTLIVKLKSLIIKRIHQDSTSPKADINFSDYLSQKMGYDYSYLNQLFAEQEGKTIGKFIVSQKIERVKELLMYDELSLSEIAWQMNYSSVQYLSAQFRKHTGLTPSGYKESAAKQRRPLDSL